MSHELAKSLVNWASPWSFIIWLNFMLFLLVFLLYVLNECIKVFWVDIDVNCWTLLFKPCVEFEISAFKPCLLVCRVVILEIHVLWACRNSQLVVSLKGAKPVECLLYKHLWWNWSWLITWNYFKDTSASSFMLDKDGVRSLPSWILFS